MMSPADLPASTVATGHSGLRPAGDEDPTLAVSGAPPANDEVPLQLGPYRIVKRLGRGGMGLVLQAVDSRDGRDVAVKLLSSAHGDPAVLMRFRREFRAVRPLNHPHVVEMFDADFQERHPYFVMELVDGQTLRQHAHAAWGGPGNPALASRSRELLELIRQVVDALGYIHGQRLVHRDLKPDNVMVEGGDSPRAKLMDFGLAKAMDASMSFTRSGYVLGTVAYMAPEQILGHKDLDGRVDYYALGVTLYELLTGQQPFRGPNPYAVLNLHIKGEVQRPSELAPWIEPKLEALVLDLMARRPEDRPSTAAEILRRLDGLGDRHGAERPDEHAIVHDVLVPAFVGHQDLGRRLGQSLQVLEFGSAHPQVLLLEGAAGLGKTRWLDAAADWAKQELYPVTRSSCQQEARAPFSAFRALLEGAGEELGALTEEQKRFLAPVARLAPGLRESLATGERITAENALPAAMKTLELAFGNQPQLFLLDDVHWADELSLEFLELLARAPGPLPLLVVATYRPEAIGPDHPLQSSSWNREALAPFTAELMRTLLASSLGEPAEMLSDGLLDLIVSGANGSPLTALQTLSRLVSQGRVRRTGNRIVLEREPDSDSAETADIATARLGDMVRLEQKILDLAAVFGKGIPLELLAASIDEDESRILDALNRLLQRRVLRTVRRVPEAYEFAQPAIRDAVYSHLDERRRRELHGRAARALQKGVEEEDSILEVLAYHYRAAGELEPALRYVKKAVGKAARMYAHRDALKFANEGLEMAARLDSDAEASAIRWELLSQQTRAWLQLGDLGEALAVARAAREAATMTNSARSRSGAENNLGLLYKRLRRFQPAREHFEIALELARAGGLKDVEAHVLSNLGGLLIEHGQRERARELLEAAVELESQLGNESRETVALLNIARLDLDAGRMDEARSELTQVKLLASRLGLEIEGVGARVLDGRGLRMQGNWQDAEKQWRDALELGRKVSDTSWTARASLQLADLEADRGRLDRAGAWLAELEIASAAGQEATPSAAAQATLRLQEPKLRNRYKRLRAKLEFLRGEWVSAMRSLEEMAEEVDPGDPEQNLVLVLQARVYSTVGRTREALGLLDRIEKQSVDVQMQSFLTPVRFMRAVVNHEMARTSGVDLSDLRLLRQEAHSRGEELWARRIQVRELAAGQDPAADGWRAAMEVFGAQQASADLARTILLQAETWLTSDSAAAADLLQSRRADVVGLEIPWLQLIYHSLCVAAEVPDAQTQAKSRALDLLRSLTTPLDERERNSFLRRPAVQAIRRRLGPRA